MAQNGMLDRDTLVKECNSAIDRYQEVWSTIKAKEKDIDSFTTDKTIESQSFDNLKAVMSDYILVIGAMGTAVNFDLNDCQMLKKTINNVDTNKIDVGNLQNQVATAETTIETNKSRLENTQKNLNSCANDNSEAAAQRSTQLRNDIRNYSYNIKNYNEIVNTCKHYIQEYQDIEKNTSNFFTQGKAYRDKANGLLDEIMGAFTNGQYIPKQVSTFRNDLAGDESVKATLSIAYESNIEKLGISKNRIKKLKEYGLSMRDIYQMYQDPQTSKKVLYIIKGDKESLKKLFSENPEMVDANTKVFLATYINVVYHKDKKAFCELETIKNTSGVYAKTVDNVTGNTKYEKERNITVEAILRDGKLEEYRSAIKSKDYKLAAKILEENKERLGNYSYEWDNIILSENLALAKAYSNQTATCYNAAKDPNNIYKDENMKHAKKMYSSYKEIMETVSAVSAVKDLNAKNGMVLLDKPVKDKENNTEGFEIRKYNLSDLKFSEKEYKTTLKIDYKNMFENVDNGNDDLKNISDKQKEDYKKIREDKKQFAKTLGFSTLQLIPGAGQMYDVLYSLDQINSSNYNCILGQDKVPEKAQTGVHSVLNAGTAVAQAKKIQEDYYKAEKDYNDTVDFAYSKWFGSFCCYDDGTDEIGKKGSREYNYSYITDAGFDPCIRIQMQKWEKNGMEDAVELEYIKEGDKELFMNELKKHKKVYNTFKDRNIDLKNPSEKNKFISNMKELGDYLDHDKYVKSSHVIRKYFDDGVSRVRDELIS